MELTNTNKLEKVFEYLKNQNMTKEDYEQLIKFSNDQISENKNKNYLTKLLNKLNNFCEFKEPCELLYLFKTIKNINLDLVEINDEKSYNINFSFKNYDNNDYNIKITYIINLCKKRTELEFFHNIYVNSVDYKNFDDLIKAFNWNYVSASDLRYVFTKMLEVFDTIDFIIW